MVTSGPVTIGFDDVSLDRAGRMSVSLWPGAADCPVFTYWFPLLCWLSPETMRPASLAALASERFVYPVELRYEAPEWCADASADEPLAALAPAVQRAVTERRALIVMSSAHEGLSHYKPGSLYSGLLLDRLAAFARWYGLSADQLWYVSGNLDAAAEVRDWCRDRNLAAAPFTLRVCEPFSAFVGACTRESMRRRRAPAVRTWSARRGPSRIGWQSSQVSWLPYEFPGLAEHPAAEPARFRYACLNRMLRAHRWQVLTRIWQEGLLSDGLVSFPRPSFEDMEDRGIDGSTATARQLVELLPLSVDGEQRFNDDSFFSDNSSYIRLHPRDILRECAMEIVTETQNTEHRFVSEKTFKALLGRGPAAVVGPRGVLAYLRSLGVQTWPDELDEAYDEIPEADGRLAAALDSAVACARRPGWASADSRAARAGNLRWLTEAHKPWDDLTRELAETLRQL